MDKLTVHLQKWNERRPDPEVNKEEALRLLEQTAGLFRQHPGEISREELFSFLDITRRSEFLSALASQDTRERWAELVCSILQHTNFSLLDMMEQRVAAHPNHILFRDQISTTPVDWSYEQIYRHLREIAALLYHTGGSGPRVAIYTENCLEGACTDLACLMFDIFVTPVSPHFKQEIVVEIFKLLNVNIVLTDTDERLVMLKSVAERLSWPLHIFSLQPLAGRNMKVPYLPEICKTLSMSEVDSILGRRVIRTTASVATTMFTSGSTGLPKGVSFSIYNIVSKRFCRAAALPMVDNEVFLCYLPLFHTFGRYLEMTGAIFWSGTYIFAGNTSAETLLSLFPKVNPTGFISIPLRWQELYDRCQEVIENVDSYELRANAVRSITGAGLHWGLSAAGYLDPAVFRFFNEYGIRLNSGFGMTEATGGITMTPPGAYHDGTVGIPLPGVKTRLTEESELELSGHYIGRYLEDAPPEAEIAYPKGNEHDYWMKTGDVFRISADGFYEIVDRVKDIYKNNRGQTVAPQVLERKFHQVPGIQRVFLVGDNRPYNVLLIVPDRNDTIFHQSDQDNLLEYFHQIIMAANADVAPYERVINFTLLDRDFDAGKGELTPKGSYNRKAIENNFREIIEQLYLGKVVTIQAGTFTIQIPKWFFRDLGILENDLKYEKGRLINIVNKKQLVVRKAGKGRFQIGNFLYRITGELVDMGVFTRQPKIWMGNAPLIGFCPIKEGWDLSMDSVGMDISVAQFVRIPPDQLPVIHGIRNQQLMQMNNLLFKTYSAEFTDAYTALEELGSFLSDADPRVMMALRYRIEALAYHPEEEIRCLAYRLILLSAAHPSGVVTVPAFIESGLSFLNEESIRKIAAGNFGRHRLDALKQRLYWYRTHLKWPAGERQRRAFEDVLRMLYHFALLHIEFYVPVRAELSRWILHKQDPWLSSLARKFFNELAANFEVTMERTIPRQPAKVWESKLVFENGIADFDKDRMTKIFRTSPFLEESIFLTFSDSTFRLTDVPDKGIWVLRLTAFKEFQHYRISINTLAGKHYDLHLVMSDSPTFSGRPETFYWLASLAGFPHGPAVAPMLGSSRPGLGVLSTQYIGGLTAWDKIRELSEIHRSSGQVRASAWKKIFVKSFAVILKAWQHSGRQIVPCVVTPSNIVIPEMEFRDSALIVSLAGWSDYKNTRSLIEPMVQDFYCRVVSVYPWCRQQLSPAWIFDAVMEALGTEEAFEFIRMMERDFRGHGITCFDGTSLHQLIQAFLSEGKQKIYLPLALYSAIDQYQEWYRMNPLTTPSAREQTIFELLELFRLQGIPEYGRYFFYRHTFFSDSEEAIQAAFDKLLAKLQERQGGLAIQLLELSELQSALHDQGAISVFTRMVFPKLESGTKVDFVKVPKTDTAQVVVRFSVFDKTGHVYTLREPLEPKETGQLYQLFFKEKYPKEISDQDHQYVLTDEQSRIVGGLTYRHIEDNNILLDGIVVTSVLQGKGLASAMMEKFFASMAAQGIEVVRAHFLFGNYYMKHLFEVDKKWGALIKRLNE